MWINEPDLFSLAPFSPDSLERQALRVQTPTDADRICEGAKVLLRRLKIRIEK